MKVKIIMPRRKPKKQKPKKLKESKGRIGLMKMVEVDGKTLERIAEISRIKLADKELLKFASEINEILVHFTKIKDIEERGEELYYLIKGLGALREDVPEKKESAVIRKNFAREEESYMLAPRSL